MGSPSRASSTLFGIVLAVLAIGCSPPELPMAPTPLVTGVILYEHANFLGNSAYLTADVADLRHFKGPCIKDDGESSTRDWNDCVSSVRVAPGWRATLYRGTNFHDDALELREDIPNLQLVPQHDCVKGGLNDCVSSVRVRQQ